MFSSDPNIQFVYQNYDPVSLQVFEEDKWLLDTINDIRNTYLTTDAGNVFWNIYFR